MASRTTDMQITSNMGLMMTYTVKRGKARASITIQRPAYGDAFIGCMKYVDEARSTFRALSFDPTKMSDGNGIATKIWAELTEFLRKEYTETTNE